jgi:hypothetical protein
LRGGKKNVYRHLKKTGTDSSRFLDL